MAKPPVKCCMTRVAFCVKSSPFIGESIIRAHVDKYEAEFPVAAAEIKDNMYVDDLDTGADNEEDAISLRRDVSELMKKGGFHINVFIKHWVLRGIHRRTVCFTKRPRLHKRSLQWKPRKRCYPDWLRHSIQLEIIHL